MLRKRAVCFVQYTNPAAYPPLEHGSRILADLGWQVLFLGTGFDGDPDQFDFPAHPNVRVLRLPKRGRGWGLKLHYGLFVLWCVYHSVRFRPAWIYASDAFAAPAGLLAHSVLGCDAIYHEHDAPPQSGSLFFRVVLAARRSLVARVRAVVIPNTSRAETFRRDVNAGVPVQVVWNCPSKEEVKPQRATSNKTVFYQGSINAQRLPTTLLDALLLLEPATSLAFAGYTTIGDPSYISRFLKAADDMGLGSRVHYLGSVRLRSQLLERMRNAAVGLMLMPARSDDPNMTSMVGASNKAFDYLACGLPILVSNQTEWEETFVKPGYALSCDPESAQSIARALGRLLNASDQAWAMGKQGQARVVAEWNYEAQFAPVLRLMEG